MKKFVSFLAIALLAITFVSCSKNTPEGVVEQYISNLQAGKYEDAIDLFYFKKGLSEKEKEGYANLLRDKMSKDIDKKKGITGVEITNVEMGDDEKSAKVMYVVKYGDGSAKNEEANVLNIDGKWLIDSSK
ncbi:MAG: DUF4878 domain-containing protein [Bacteroidales bacterium]|mgnify:CR=1 FL=1|nr:DUF4878 domain-containing protein [Bacteroidales bacterium]